MSEIEEEIFEETATKEPEPKKKKPRKKRVISEAQRKQMLENLRKGRETSKKNRQARGQAKKVLKDKAKKNIDAIISGKEEIIEKSEPEPIVEIAPIEKVATIAKEEIKKTPKIKTSDLTAQQILLERIEELKKENLTLREKRKIKKEIAKVEKVIEKNEFMPRRPSGRSTPINIVNSNAPAKNVSTFRRPRW
tara:strand:+ start:223 stop:801 length:579 start_codon:yes stop_codon:yes gene_type:complete